MLCVSCLHMVQHTLVALFFKILLLSQLYHTTIKIQVNFLNYLILSTTSVYYITHCLLTLSHNEVYLKWLSTQAPYEMGNTWYTLYLNNISSYLGHICRVLCLYKRRLPTRLYAICITVTRTTRISLNYSWNKNKLFNNCFIQTTSLLNLAYNLLE